MMTTTATLTASKRERNECATQLRALARRITSNILAPEDNAYDYADALRVLAREVQRGWFFRYHDGHFEALVNGAWQIDISLTADTVRTLASLLDPEDI